MTNTRMTTLAGCLAVAALILVAPRADAAPKKGVTFDVTCPGLGSFQVATPPGNGTFTPAFGAGRSFPTG